MPWTDVKAIPALRASLSRRWRIPVALALRLRSYSACGMSASLYQ
jgi:hypothetical protein